MTRRLTFNAVQATGAPARGGGGRLADIETWTDLAQILEQGRFDMLMLPGPAADAVPAVDPLQVAVAMGFVTEHLRFAVPAPGTGEPPAAFADRLASAARLTGGRIAWMIDGGARRSPAEGAVEAVRGVLADRGLGGAAGPALVHLASDGPGRRLAGRHADQVHLLGETADALLAHADEVRGEAARAGRDPRSIRIQSRLFLLLGETAAEASSKHAAYARTGRLPAGIPVVSGEPARVADAVRSLAAETDLDGFDLMVPYVPEGFDDVLDLLIPDLRRSGTWREAYETGPLRERFAAEAPPPAPAARVVRLSDRTVMA